MRGPQISVHSSTVLDVTIHDVKWIPSSARFCVLGAHAKGTGSVQVFELDSKGANGASFIAMNLKGKCVHEQSLKYGTFYGSDAVKCALIAGDFSGQLSSWDLKNLTKPK